MLHEVYCSCVALKLGRKVSGLWSGLSDAATADQQVAKYNEDCSFPEELRVLSA